MLTRAADFKRTTRLADLVPGLKKSGAYHVGPCPFCGGRDRFNVKSTEEGDLWICRQCGDGRYHDAVDFLMRQTGRPFAEIVGGHVDAVTQRQTATPTAAIVPELAQPPAEEWQIAAIVAAGECADYLRGGTADAVAVMRYLQDGRRLSPTTIDDYTIGYNPTWRNVAGGRMAPGITIPCMVDGELWYLQVRTTATARAAAEGAGHRLGKYHALTGSKLGALFNANELIGAAAVFVVEGEFDCLCLRQSTGAAVVTMGSAGSLPSNAWLRYFAAVKDIILLLDDDDAGRQSLARWQKKLPRARAARLPDGSKDVTDFKRGGGYVAGWAAAVLRGEA